MSTRAPSTAPPPVPSMPTRGQRRSSSSYPSVMPHHRRDDRGYKRGITPPAHHRNDSYSYPAMARTVPGTVEPRQMGRGPSPYRHVQEDGYHSMPPHPSASRAATSFGSVMGSPAAGITAGHYSRSAPSPFDSERSAYEGQYVNVYPNEQSVPYGTVEPTSRQVSARLRIPPPSFDQLVNDLMQHPALALILKKVIETANGPPLKLNDSDPELEEVDALLKDVANFAVQTDVGEASQRENSLTVFLAGMMTALDALKRGPAGLNIPPVLRASLSTVSSMTDANTRQGGYPDIRTPTAYPALTRTRAPGPRPKLSAAAREILEKWFADQYDNPYPTDEEKLMLANQCGIRLNQVNNFFGNKRMRLKRKAMVLEPSADAPKQGGKENGSVLAPFAKWRTYVLSKMPTAADAAANTGTPAQVSASREKPRQKAHKANSESSGPVSSESTVAQDPEHRR